MKKLEAALAMTWYEPVAFERYLRNELTKRKHVRPQEIEKQQQIDDLTEQLRISRV